MNIVTFYDIVIEMEFDTKHPPHFIATYTHYRAKVVIETGEIIEGKLGNYSGEMVEEWRQIHALELHENWKLAALGQPLKPIAPLE